MSNDEASEILKVDFKQVIVIDNVYRIHFVILSKKEEFFFLIFRLTMLTIIWIILCLFQQHVIMSTMISEVEDKRELSTRTSFYFFFVYVTIEIFVFKDLNKQ